MALALAACGGGGGGGTSTPAGPVTSADGSWLSFSPASTEVSTFEGESTSFSITATSSRTFDKPFNIGVVDSSGTTTTAVQVSAVDGLTYVANFKTSPTLPAGVRQVSLEVRLCEDNAATCSKPLPGSPWHVPLKVTVKPAAEAAQRLALSTPSLQVEKYPDEMVRLDFSGQFKGDLQGKVFRVGVFDKASLSTTSVQTSPEGFQATLEISTSLPEGKHSSNLEVRLCYDDPVFCRQPVAGSPWLLPLGVVVKNPINLKPLTAVPGLGAWSTYQGNAAHSGFVDASFDVANFTRRLSIPAATPNIVHDNGAAFDSGKVFMVPSFGSGDNAELIAVNETDASVVWRASLGSIFRANPPAVGNGQVYVTTIGPNSFLWIFDEQSGTLLSKTVMFSSANMFFQAPTVLGTGVYTSNDNVQSTSKFSSVTLGKVWEAGDKPQYVGATPTVDAANVYSYMDGKMSALNTSDGKLNWEIIDPDYSYGQSVVTVLSGKYAIVQYAGRLRGFDTSTHTRIWSVANQFFGQPAVGNGLVYVLRDASVLEARALADGKLQWTSEALKGSVSDHVIVSRNLAFVGGGDKTFAIDLATQKVVWTYAVGGSLSISSNGVLYIFTKNGKLIAINLQ